MPSKLKRSRKWGPQPSEPHVQHQVRCAGDGETPPRSDAVTGHRSLLVAHLGNIADRAGRKLAWDAAKGDFANDAMASGMLDRTARTPWDAISL